MVVALAHIHEKAAHEGVSLMADAAADFEALRLERAMERFDSARAIQPGDAEASVNRSCTGWRGHRFQAALFREESLEAVEEAIRLAEEGRETRDMMRRAVWQVQLYTANDERARRFEASDPLIAPGHDAAAAEPPGPPLPPELAEPLFVSAMEVLRWHLHGTQLMVLESLIRYGIRPEVVLERAVELETALRANRPGYLFPGYQGDQREAERRQIMDGARVLQARALTQLGRTEAAEELFEELGRGAPGRRTLGEFGRHLLRTGRAAEALDVLVRAVAYGGSRYRGVAEYAATAAGLPVDVVDERLAVQRPLVQAERERKALGDRLGLAAPELALPDQHGVEWRLGDLVGKVVVLKFWATWCGPCLAEFPHFVKLLEKYEGDEEVAFLTVASAGSAPEAVDEVRSENGYTFPVLIDTRGSALDFEILGYPTTIYLDPEGLIQYRRTGFDEAGYERQTSIHIDALRRSRTEDPSP
ncbi:MAG: TlpA family protein disulfide reductase [Gemmatimonadetes bacterium]|nr:TlpA family protein disulfide reductase [Gemmatimonadota bacterium]MYK65125.1 TlpA family protein disulfide reductase [Gemmatimonadota bacterium]